MRELVCFHKYPDSCGDCEGNRKRNADRSIQPGGSRQRGSGDLLGEEYLYAKVKDEVLKLKLEDNKAAKNLCQEIKKDDLELNADDFEEFAKYVKLNSIDDKDIKEIDVKVGDVVIDKDNKLYIFFKNYTGSYQKVASISNANSENLQSTLGYKEENIKIKLSVNNK